MTNEIKLEAKVSGFYKLEAVKYDDAGNEISRRLAADWFPNLITDQGLNRLGAFTDYLGNCQVGTGNAAPANGNTPLVTFVGNTASVSAETVTNGGSPDYWTQTSRTYTFAVGVATGVLAEIGIGWSSGGGTLFSRALILDGAGAATTITILSDESLVATYATRIYPPIVDQTGTFLISGASHSYTVRASLVTTYASSGAAGWGIPGSSGSSAFPSSVINKAYTGAIGAITASPASAVANITAVDNSAYVNLSLSRTCVFTWGTSAAAANYRSFYFQAGWGGYQMEVSPTITKTTINELKLTCTHTWARGPVV